MASLALVFFITLFVFGAKLLGWDDPHGQVQIGLIMSFLFGAICGRRIR